MICWHTYTTLAPCSHWPIMSISAGDVNQALLRQHRKTERNSLFLVKCSYCRPPGVTEVRQQEQGEGEITSVSMCLVTNHLTSHQNGLKPKRESIGSWNSNIDQGSNLQAQLNVGTLSMSSGSVSLCISHLSFSVLVSLSWERWSLLLPSSQRSSS